MTGGGFGFVVFANDLPSRNAVEDTVIRNCSSKVWSFRGKGKEDLRRIERDALG